MNKKFPISGKINSKCYSPYIYSVA